MDWAKYQIDIPPVMQDVRQEEATLPRHYSLGVFDIGCGRGQRFCTHVGNLRFREIVNAHVDSYLNAHSKIAKTSLIVSILDEVRKGRADGTNKGRFVKQQEDGSWVELGDAASRDKVSNALRSAVATRKGGVDTAGSVETQSLSSPSAEGFEMEEREQEESEHRACRLTSEASQARETGDAPRVARQEDTRCHPGNTLVSATLGNNEHLLPFLASLSSSSDSNGTVESSSLDRNTPGKEGYQSFADISAVIKAFYGSVARGAYDQSNAGLTHLPRPSSAITSTAATDSKTSSGRKLASSERKDAKMTKNRTGLSDLKPRNGFSASTAASGDLRAQFPERTKVSNSKKASVGDDGKSPTGRKKRRDAGKKRKPVDTTTASTPRKTPKTDEKIKAVNSADALFHAVSSDYATTRKVPTTPKVAELPALPMTRRSQEQLPVVTPRDDDKIGSKRVHRPKVNMASFLANSNSDRSRAVLKEGTAVEDLDAVSSLLLLKAGFTSYSRQLASSDR